MAKKYFTDESLQTFVDEVQSYTDNAVSGKANSSHNHAASNITSGTLSSDRLPTVPITKGGTGATTASGALTNLGVTATAAELNKMDGVTATTTELNYVDGVTSNIQTQLDSKASSSHNHIYYGVCSTAADAAAKTVTIDNFSLVTGAMVIVKFTNANSIASPTLNVNGTGAKPICRYGTTAASTGTSTTGWRAGAVQMFVYDGTSWIRDYWENTTYSPASLGSGYGTCSTAAATTAKTATLSSYSLTTGGIVSVKFTNAVPASATLNINSKGAKSIYYKGAAITANVIKAGDIATFVYSSQYHLLSVDRWHNDLAGKQNTITGAATTITGSDLTASRALISDSSGKVAVSAVTSTELGYLDGVTSGVQTQLNGKVPTTRKINNKALSDDIALNASDVGALSTSGGTVSGNVAMNGTLTVNGIKISGYDSMGNNTTADKVLIVRSEDDHYVAYITPENICKQGITGGVSSVVTDDFTASRALVSNASGKIASSAVTSTELGYLDGVTSNIQTQLNSKSASDHTHNYAGSSSAGGAATSANKVNKSLTVKLNGGTTEGTNMFTFNGSTAKSINVTPAAIGASSTSHTHELSDDKIAGILPAAKGGTGNNITSYPDSSLLCKQTDSNGKAYIDYMSASSIRTNLNVYSKTQVDDSFLSTSGGVVNGIICVDGEGAGITVEQGGISIANSKSLMSKDASGNERIIAQITESDNLLIGTNSTFGHTGNTTIYAANGEINLTNTFGTISFVTDGTVRVPHNLRTGKSIYPQTDNASQCGLSSNRWSQVYAGKSAISTSDLNQKRNLSEIDDKYIELFDLVQPYSYMFKDGDRVHTGFISQYVEEAIEKVGLTPKDLAFFCKDIKMQPVYDENGDCIGSEEVYDENGNPVYTYSLRYEEYIAITVEKLKRLETKYNEKLEQLDTKLAEIEAKLS